MEILIKRLTETAKFPAYGREASSAIDLYVDIETRIDPGVTVKVRTSIAMAFPVGYIGLIVDQYEMIENESVRVTPCSIDSGHRGEIVVEITNNADTPCTFLPGAKIAQLLIEKVERAQLIEAEDVSN